MKGKQHNNKTKQKGGGGGGYISEKERSTDVYNLRQMDGQNWAIGVCYQGTLTITILRSLRSEGKGHVAGPTARPPLPPPNIM